MSTAAITTRCRTLSVIVGAAVPFALPAIARAQAHAVDPLPTPHFTIDLASPTISGPITADSVLDKPGPLVTYPGANLGLGQPFDELDAISLSRADIPVGQTIMVLFGVDRATVGLVDPDPGLVAANRPFNVKHQAARHQAAADMFMALDPFNRFGPLFTGDERVPSYFNNTLNLNQADMGGGDFDLSPEFSATVPIPPIMPIDDSDDFAYDPGTASLRAGPPVHPVFFTLKNGSPSLPFLPGSTNSGADIFVDLQPQAPGGEMLYASAASLNLQQADDIDALVVFDNGDNQYGPPAAGDQVLFSLARGSPSLAFFPGGSPADVFSSNGPFTPLNFFARANVLGLDAGLDNVDGLEVLATNDPDASRMDHALFLVIPGDYDNDGVLTSADCGAFFGCYSGSGLPYDLDGSAVHDISVGPGDVFLPGAKTVEAGDIVRWTWNGGLHNVVSGSGGQPDGAFYSGPPTSTIGTMYAVAFDEALLNLHPRYQGIYPYYSEVPFTLIMTGTITVQPDECATFDLDFDGDVDCDDWRWFRSVWATFNPDPPCPLTIPDFVSILLTKPAVSAATCLADLNGDGRTDAADIQAYVFIAPSP
jgi:plastocyanin